MMKEPTRLIDEDPGFAHLVAASHDDGPSSGQLDRAMTLATQAATETRWSSWRWLGSKAVLGIALLGALVIGGLGVREMVLSRDAAVLPSADMDGLPSSRAPALTVTSPELPTPAASVVTTISVQDLAPAPADLAETSSRAIASATGAASARGAQGGVAATPGRDSTQERDLVDAGAKRTTFREELALVSAARSALEAGDIPACLHAVDGYRDQFGSGTFAQEIEVIRIEARLASGDLPGARASAERFLATNPRSPYADRVRSLLDRTSH